MSEASLVSVSLDYYCYYYNQPLCVDLLKMGWKAAQEPALMSLMGW